MQNLDVDFWFLSEDWVCEIKDPWNNTTLQIISIWAEHYCMICIGWKQLKTYLKYDIESQLIDWLITTTIPVERYERIIESVVKVRDSSIL